ncbi:MAG: flagellar basal body P-ring formation protein FlgA [Candidatus Accumulibacter sp.]|jgi:flagella basal body P-ring formation protein FlgA|uniref:Flagella basal body P-ring formation protein FlgA n=1 Tax=Candidatus Accumulibacter affinis TaxID=2954384 RepID=A0A935T8K4_9PROT|nr:flagellar basal body P-ring formation protein FlgA [Candidatus Accumulibacter affinis]
MFNPPVSRRPARLPRLLCAMLAVTSNALCAQTSLATALDQFLRTQTQGLPGKVSYSVGALERRAQLGACDAFEPFLPPGSRLWGKSTVGVRCLGPTAWTVYVPVQVRISGTYLVTARQLAPGQVVSSADLLSQSGDLGALPASVVTDPAQAIGKTIRNGIAAGHPLRSDLLTAAWAVQQGQSVRLLTTGAGFTISNEGKALNNATDGQIAQVRTASGQVVSGIARSGGVVEVSY